MQRIIQAVLILIVSLSLAGTPAPVAAAPDILSAPDLLAGAPDILSAPDILAGAPTAATQTAAQFNIDGQVLALQAGGIYLAAPSHALHITFQDANLVDPQSSGVAADLSGAGSIMAPSSPSLSLPDAAVPDAHTERLAQASWSSLWAGISLRYQPTPDGRLQSTYTLAAGANPDQIRLDYNAQLSLLDDGSLRIVQAGPNPDDLSESAPLAWQEIDGQRVAVDVAFRLLPAAAEGHSTLGFSLGAYDPAYALTIDPVLIWNRFVGSSDDDRAYGVAVDAAGNVYLIGYNFLGWGSPVSPFSELYEIFVAKLNTDGALQWHTFLGGSGNDFGYGIAVNGSGVYLTGASDAAWELGPGEAAPIVANHGGPDAFVAKLNFNGVLQWHTFLGHKSGVEVGRRLALDGSGNIYIVGQSSSLSWGSPTITPNGSREAFVARLDSSGSLVWNAFLGSGGEDDGTGIVVDGSGLVIGGKSDGPWGLAPKRAYSGGRDGFAARLTLAGAFQWNTFFGGANDDEVTDLAIDASANVYVGGQGFSAWGGLLTMTPYHGSLDAFVAKLNPSGDMVWNTFLGSENMDYGMGLGVSSAGFVVVTGSSNMPWSNVIMHSGGGNYDSYVASLSSTNGALQWVSFVGGSDGSDSGEDVTADAAGNLYVVGLTGESWLTPVHYFSGGLDSFALKLSSSGIILWNTFLGGAPDDLGLAVITDNSGAVYMTGMSVTYWGSAVRPYTAGNDAFVVKFDTQGNQLWLTFLGGAGNDSGQDLALDDAGHLFVTGISSADWGTSPKRGYTGGLDGFVARLDMATGALQWHTFLGGSGNDSGGTLAADAAGNSMLAGYSNATWGTPVRAYSNGLDAYAARLNTNGVLVWNTFLGNSGTDIAYGLALPNASDLFVGGISAATWGTPKRAHSAANDGFVARLDTSNGALIYNTFLGGSGSDAVNDLAANAQGIYAGGESPSTWGTPVRAYSALTDGFAARLDYNLNLVWNSFVGGSGGDFITGIAVDPTGQVFLFGDGASAWGNQSAAYGGYDVSVAVLNANGNLLNNTFYGGSGDDYSAGIFRSAEGSLYLSGYSSIAWGPVYTITSGLDAFLARVYPFGMYLPAVIR
jgi:hypothetical protein